MHPGAMDETKKRYVPAWVRDDPEVLADWLSIDWEAEAKLYEEMGRRPLRENQAVIGGWRAEGVTPTWTSRTIPHALSRDARRQASRPP